MFACPEIQRHVQQAAALTANWMPHLLLTISSMSRSRFTATVHRRQRHGVPSKPGVKVKKKSIASGGVSSNACAFSIFRQSSNQRYGHATQSRWKLYAMNDRSTPQKIATGPPPALQKAAREPDILQLNRVRLRIKANRGQSLLLPIRKHARARLRFLQLFHDSKILLR